MGALDTLASTPIIHRIWACSNE